LGITLKMAMCTIFGAATFGGVGSVRSAQQLRMRSYFCSPGQASGCESEGCL